MLFGSQSTFAIECAVTATTSHGAPTLYGTMYFWIGGRRIGPEGEYFLLDNLDSLRRTIATRDLRQALRLEDSPRHQDSLEYVYHCMFSLEAACDDEARRQVEALCVSLPTFDHEFVILLDRGDHEVLVWRETEGGPSREVELSAGKFEGVAAEFIAWANRAIQPPDADQLAARAKPDAQQKRWYARTASGDYYVYERSGSTLVYRFSIPESHAEINVPRAIRGTPD